MEPMQSSQEQIDKAIKNGAVAQRWLKRARKDFEIVQKMVPTSKPKTKNGGFSNDPALAIYLLQQTSEKTVKALLVANGEPEEKLASRVGHASLAGYLNFLETLLDNKSLSSAIDMLYSGFDFSNAREDFPREFSDADMEARKLRRRSSPKRNEKDMEFWRGMSSLGLDHILILINKLDAIRTASIYCVNAKKNLLPKLKLDPSDLKVVQGRTRLIEEVTGD